MDNHKNFSLSVIATPPSPSTSGVSLVISSGTGSLFPAPPMNCTIWPANALPSASNAEIVRVPAIASDNFTIVRQQEGTSARAIVAGDQIAATITVKTMTDVENAIPIHGTLALGNLVSSGSVTGLALPFTPSMVIATVRKQANQLNLFAMVIDGSVTTDGFNFELGPGQTDSTNYKLDYLIIP